jgi:pimeloyl-ACP methyl ester carboxylesterase
MTNQQQDQSPGTPSFEAKSEMIDVGGYRLALTSSGAGSPTVVLETGLGAEGNEWAVIERAISPSNRIIHYDRANRGASDRAPGPRTALDMVGDLHRLLRTAGIGGPYVLVGHSFGGLLMRLYAHHHRDEVAGLVLVDAMHEDQFDVFGPLFSRASPSDAPELVKMRAFWQGGWRSPAATEEQIDFATSFRQLAEVVSLGSIPLHVLIAGTFLNSSLVPSQSRASLQARWQAQRMEFLNLSTHASYSLALNSGHFVQREAPELVSEAIKLTLAAATRLSNGGGGRP